MKKIALVICALLLGVMLTGCQREVVQQIPAPQPQRQPRPNIIVVPPAQPCQPPRPNINIQINPNRHHHDHCR